MSSTAQPTRKYFLRDEVVICNNAASAWVTVDGTVIDITPLFQAALGKPPMSQNLQWLLAFAGKDLSCFFDGRLALVERNNWLGERVPVFMPGMERNPATRLCWWRDPALVIGRLTFQPCPVKIINTLTFHATEMVVCYEDTIAVVRDKFLRYNDNALQYEWRKDLAAGEEEGKLRMEGTLAENGFRIDGPSPVAIIWIVFVLPPDDTGAHAQPDPLIRPVPGKCSPRPTEEKQSAGQENGQPAGEN